MSHIVFIVGSYYPDFQTIGACCDYIAEELAKQHNVITVVCRKSRLGQSIRENYEGQTIIRVSHRWWDFRLELDEKLKKSSGIIKKCYMLLLNAVRAKEYLQIVFSRVSLQKAWINAYANALESIENQINVIIPVCFPMEAVVAGMVYMQKQIRMT